MDRVGNLAWHGLEVRLDTQVGRTPRTSVQKVAVACDSSAMCRWAGRFASPVEVPAVLSGEESLGDPLCLVGEERIGVRARIHPLELAQNLKDHEPVQVGVGAQ